MGGTSESAMDTEKRATREHIGEHVSSWALRLGPPGKLTLEGKEPGLLHHYLPPCWAQGWFQGVKSRHSGLSVPSWACFQPMNAHRQNVVSACRGSGAVSVERIKLGY